MTTQVIWIDANIDHEENRNYIKELNLMGSIRLGLFKDVNKAITHLKMIEFKATKIIVNNKLYSEFVTKFKENIIDMCIAPKIIIFAKNKDDFIKKNKDFNNNLFYSYGGIAVSFEEIKKFLKNEKMVKIQSDDDIQLTFEKIDNINKLALPMFFKTLIDNQSINNIEKYTNKLYDKYSKEKEELKELLGSIKSLNDIPVEILCKYYAKLYTADSSFHRKINKDLGLNKKEEYLSFIKILYEGVKLKSLPLANNNILFRGSKISNKEINDIKGFIEDKKDGLPSSIVFSKSFLSFTKDKNIAEKFISNKNIEGLSNVLFILEKDDNIGYNLSTHGDLEKISYFPNEREVLFFPFSSFEIKDIKYVNSRYEIKLLYLGKYLKDIKNNINENRLPDSKFKKQLTEFGLIPENKIININNKILYKKYKEYINNDNNNNNIFEEMDINSYDINEDIQLVNLKIGKISLDIKEYNLDSNKRLSKINEYFKNPPLIGLNNIGAAPYMNATLQCFCNIPKFVNYFKYNKEIIQKIKNDINSGNNLLSSSFKLLIEKLWPDNFNKINNSYTPMEFKKKISKMNLLFKDNAVNDARDLINFLINTLHNELNKAVKKNIINIGINEDGSNKQLMFNLFCQDFINNNKSIISDLFFGVNCKIYQCQNCMVKSYIYHAYFFFEFPLEEVIKFKKQNILNYNYNYDMNFNKNIININECFLYDQRINYMTSENAIYCKFCRKTSNHTMSTLISFGPEIIIIILNRGKGFQYNVKINFDEELHLDKFIEYKETGFNYKLIGVISYLGESEMRHFIAYCKNPITNTWYKFNDSFVSEVRDSNFKTKAIDFAMPYVLFYQKIGV